MVLYEENFRKLAERYCQIVSHHGVRAVPYRDRSLLCFQRLSDDKKIETIQILKINCDVLEKVLNGNPGRDIGETPNLCC